MVLYSSILAWEIPWTEEPGRLQFMGLQSQTRLSSTHIYFCQQIFSPRVFILCSLDSMNQEGGGGNTGVFF